GPAWTRLADGQWYLHLFAPEQPDFNWEHPAVADEFRSILRFWLDMGVDGFRIDVAHGLVKAEGLPDIGGGDQLKLLGNDVMPFFDQDGVHDIYRSWRTILDEYDGERIFVAEAWTPTVERTANYVRPDELHQAFNFQYLGAPWEASELRKIIDTSLDAMRPVHAPATWVLSNHDVTRHATRYANPPGLGTQIRTPGDRELGLRRARAATLLMLALPGSAYVYQGEELGLPDVTDLPDEVRQDPSFFRAQGQDGFRDGCRVPIPWTRSGSSYGFGDGGSWLPQPDSWGELSVEAQTGVEGSTLEMYRSALAVRRAQGGLGAGDSITWRENLPEGVLCFERPGFLCTVNTTGAPVRIPVPGTVLLSSSPVAAEDGEGREGREVSVPADCTIWWAV
ncbi:alpha-amylase family glycosyl hydrolase, partial [Streptomyces sp. NPDC050095]|uniref:alpha-amylase family glycosyl hydrolase n=1 Tax=unclassified Streptomyces TaxID=2593676 RepID=UPI003414559F